MTNPIGRLYQSRDRKEAGHCLPSKTIPDHQNHDTLPME